MENSLKPSEQLLGKPHPPSMRADLQLLCGIYDLLHEIKAAQTPRVEMAVKSRVKPQKSE